MKLKPEQWTHHHTHRLYHLSLGICFGFISVVLIGGMVTAFLGASASTQSLSGDISATALVEGVNPGPISSGSSGSPPVATKNPTITIVAEPQGQIPARGDAYVFGIQSPAFSGQASVPNGLVFITLRGKTDLNSTAQADSNGHWYWKSPEILPVGSYSITAAVFDSYDLTRSGSAKVNFIIELPAGQKPQPGNGGGSGPGSGLNLPPPPGGIPANLRFGVFLTVLPEYKIIESGKKVVVGVSLVSNSEKEVSDQDLEFRVFAPSGKIILQTKDAVSFSQLSKYLKTFLVAPATPAGKYTITVTSVFQGIRSETSDTFTVTSPATVAAPVTQINQFTTIQQWPWLIWLLLLLLLIMFIIMTIIAYHQVRHHNGELNKLQSNQF